MAEEQQYVKYDNVLLGILQNCGKIEPFLEAIFSFLARRTDFFRWMHSKDDKMGFPPGVAEKMVIKIFERYQETVLRHEPSFKEWKKKNAKPDKMNESTVNKQKIPDVPEPVNEVEISTSSKHSPKEGTTVSKSTAEKKSDSAESVSSKKEIFEKEKVKVNDTDEVKSSISSSDAFNGGVTESYTWSQTLSDVDIKIPIPTYVKKSKDVIVNIRHDSINVSLTSQPPTESEVKSKELLSGKLSQPIRTEESMWSLEPSKNITITLEKIKETWWTCVLEGDQEIDKQSIDTTQDIHDFDEQTQGDIRKVMYDQHQKMLGKPTSEEQKTYNMLEKAWDAEGSPFKGTPFDPSRVNIGGGGGAFPPPT